MAASDVLPADAFDQPLPAGVRPPPPPPTAAQAPSDVLPADAFAEAQAPAAVNPNLRPNQWLGFQQSIGNLATNVDKAAEAGMQRLGITPPAGLRSAQQEQAANQAQLQQAALRGERPGGYGQFAGEVLPWLAGPEGLIPRLAFAGGLGALQSNAPTAQGRATDAALAMAGGEAGRVAGKVVPKLVAPLRTVPANMARMGWQPSPGQVFGGPMQFFEGLTKRYVPMVNKAVQTSADTWAQALKDVTGAATAPRQRTVAAGQRALDKATLNPNEALATASGANAMPAPAAAPPLASPLKTAGHGGLGALAVLGGINEAKDLLHGALGHFVPSELRIPAAAGFGAAAGAGLVPYMRGARPFVQGLAAAGPGRQALASALRATVPRAAGAGVAATAPPTVRPYLVPTP